jgi:hypothetical protein
MLPGIAKNTSINPKPNTNTRSDERTHPHAANQHQHIKTQSNKSNQNNTQIQHKNNEFKQKSAPLIVVCLCHDDGATRRQWQPQREVQRVAEGSVDGVGPLLCRRGCQLTESRGNARQEGARGWWAKQDEG